MNVTKLQQIKNLLYEIGQRYPTLLGVMQKRAGKATVGHHWAQILEPYDMEDIEVICDEYSMARKAIPKPAEGLIFELREYCADEQYRRQSRLEQYEKVHRRCKAPWREAKPSSRWCRAVKHIMEHGPVKADQVDDLVAWEKTGTEPEWMEEVQQ